MGLEARCSAVWRNQESEGKAHVEAGAVEFRGDFKVKLATAGLQRVTAAGGVLTLAGPEGTLALRLGPAAPKWADKILHPPSRLDKLGVKPGQRVVILGVTDPDLPAEIGRLTTDVRTRAAKDCDWIFFGAEKPADLARLAKLKDSLTPAGAIWVVYPKGVKTITQADVMAASKAAGLVDVKVCAFSATHTALKSVIPAAARKR